MPPKARALTISHTDLSGNTGTSATETVTVDTTAPTVTITESHVGTLNIGSTSSVTFTFSEAVQGFANGDVTVSGGTLSNVTVSGTDVRVYTATFTPTAVGSASVSVGANTYTDAAGNNGAASNSLALTVLAQAGDAIIDLGTSGKLIAPVQVEGKWYYYWDRSGDGTSANTGSLNSGVDYVNHNVLDGIFTKNSVGNLEVVGGYTSDDIRYGTINGVKLALPTLGAAFPR